LIFEANYLHIPRATLPFNILGFNEIDHIKQIDIMLSQIIRFALPPPLTISAPEFLKLRQNATAAGAIAQYFGYTIPTQVAALPKQKNEVCWTIRMWTVATSLPSVRLEHAES
jgi:hypothetical protein